MLLKMLAYPGFLRLFYVTKPRRDSIVVPFSLRTSPKPLTMHFTTQAFSALCIALLVASAIASPVDDVDVS
jgi:hypothetical protein